MFIYYTYLNIVHLVGVIGELFGTDWQYVELFGTDWQYVELFGTDWQYVEFTTRFKSKTA
jgi:hypothetical protein